jgi:hypothetical protein
MFNPQVDVEVSHTPIPIPREAMEAGEMLVYPANNVLPEVATVKLKIWVPFWAMSPENVSVASVGDGPVGIVEALDDDPHDVSARSATQRRTTWQPLPIELHVRFMTVL